MEKNDILSAVVPLWHSFEELKITNEYYSAPSRLDASAVKN